LSALEEEASSAQTHGFRVKQCLNQCFWILGYLKEASVRSHHHTLPNTALQEAKERIPEAPRVKKSYGLLKLSYDVACDHIKEFIPSTKTSRKSDKGISLFSHPQFARGHPLYANESRQLRVPLLSLLEMLRDHPNHLSSGAQGCVGQFSHQADAASTVDEPYLSPRQESAKGASGFSILNREHLT